jgi:DNA-binding CsgD family transcriptional regulator
MGTATREGEWLDLVADLMGHPLVRWPADSVTRLLSATFAAPGGGFYAVEAGAPPQWHRWPPQLFAEHGAEIQRWTFEEAPRAHPLLRYYRATGDPGPMQVTDVPGLIAGPRLRHAWRERCEYWHREAVWSQVAVPLRSTPTANRSFVIGRGDPLSPEEMDLVRRLQRVLIGLDRQITAHARWAARTGEDAVPTAAEVGLTPRESAVLDLLASGGTAWAIARRLAVGERTVQKHLQRVYTKLGVADRLAAVQRAQLLGLLPPPDLRAP